MMSQTQLNNIAIFCGLVSVILAKFHISIGSDELQLTVGLVVGLWANIAQYIHRYKKGDVTVAGFKKY